MKFDPNMARDLAHSHMTEHLAAKLRQLGGSAPARFAVGEASDVARAIVSSLDMKNALLFYVLATASDFMSTQEIARQCSSTKPAVRGFLRRLKKIKVAIVHEGVPTEMLPFKHGSELWFRIGGPNDKGDKIDGGVKLTLRTNGLKFAEACDVESTNRAQKTVVTENYDGAVSQMERGTAREQSVRAKDRADFERAREQQVKGPQLDLLKTS